MCNTIISNLLWLVKRYAGMVMFLLGLFIAPSFYGFSQTAPEPRVCGALIYHAQLQKELLMDGLIREPHDEATKIWSWNGQKWELLSDKGPQARAFGGVGYDTKRNKVVLHGGRAWRGSKMNVEKDTWEWDGQEWRKISDTIGIPGQRDHFSLIDDAIESRILMIGGVELLVSKDAYVWPKNCWSWDGKSWTMLKFAWPISRISTVVYDTKRKHLLAFGGGPEQADRNEQYNDTWIYKDQQWVKFEGINPPARNGHGLVYDPHKNITVLYGGWTKTGERKLGDMWQWDGSQWHEIKMTGETPGKRGGHGMVYDLSRKKIVLFGGDTMQGVANDTWEWDGLHWSKMN